MKISTNIVVLMACALVCAAIQSTASAGEKSAAEKLNTAKPNIVFMLADDLGYGDLGCTGHPYAKTPAIDQLSRDGTLFHNLYVGGGTCCPSRTSFMTGRFPASYQKNPGSHGYGDAPTITGLLKAHGYRTGHFGKWHMGPQQTPGTYGIDEVKVIGGNRRDPRGRDAGITDATVDFIRAHKDRPFYVNVWFHTVHNPVDPPQSFVERFKHVTVKKSDFTNPDMLAKLKEYEAAGEDLDAEMHKHLGDVYQLDGHVDRILKTLDELQLTKNTIVVFTSDNGPHKYGSAGPFRAAKHSLFDGGTHQPLIVRWPGHVKAGRDDKKSVQHGVDWLPTLCAITGIKLPASITTGGSGHGTPRYVGEDMSDVWLGKERARTTDLFWRVPSTGAAAFMRRGDWKLHQPRRGAPAELYNLISDPGERENVAARHPDVAKELSAAMTQWKASLPTMYEGNDRKAEGGGN